MNDGLAAIVPSMQRFIADAAHNEISLAIGYMMSMSRHPEVAAQRPSKDAVEVPTEIG
jgi:hypothetical protein